MPFGSNVYVLFAKFTELLEVGWLVCFALLAFLVLGCLHSGYLERAGASKRSETVAVPFAFPALMAGWMA